LLYYGSPSTLNSTVIGGPKPGYQSREEGTSYSVGVGLAVRFMEVSGSMAGVIETRQQLSKLPVSEVDLELPGGTLHSVSTVTNLGVHLDENLNFDRHAVKCAAACYYQLRRIEQMKLFVDNTTLRTLVHSLVISRLDYCNGWLQCEGHCSTPTSTEQCCATGLQRPVWFTHSAAPYG
jgi:hypothetical protein